MAEKKIGTRTFKVEPMLAMDAIVLQARLLRIAGGAVEKLPEVFAGRSDGATEEERSKSNAAAVAALAAVFQANEPKEIAGVLKEVVESAMVLRPSGTYDQVDMDGDFTGSLKDVLPVAVFVLKEQFGDFFSGALATGKAKMKAAG